MLHSKLLILVLFAFLTGCTVTGPADDGYENDNEWVDNGRLLSEDTKRIYGTSEQQSSKTDNSPDSDTNLKAEMDYSAYKQWQQAREKNTSEYQKFKQWQEFEEYQRWKEQQSQ